MMMDCMLSFIYALPDNLPFFFFLKFIFSFVIAKKGGENRYRQKGYTGFFFFFIMNSERRRREKGHLSMHQCSSSSFLFFVY